MAELGRLDRMPLHRLRAIAAALDAEIVLTVRRRGGDLDRLLDEGHAAVVGRVITMLEAAGWEARPEVTFSVYGERGSIDVVAWHAPTRTLLVVEVKTELTSVEETLRRHDVKARLAGRIVRERFGWDPLVVARALVLPDLSTSRRRVGRHEQVLGRAYPLRGAAFRAWLRRPIGAVSGLLCLSLTTGDRGRCGPISRRRVRRAAPGVSPVRDRA